MSEVITKFAQVATPVDDVLDRLKDREDALSRWAVLVGTPGTSSLAHSAVAVM